MGACASCLGLSRRENNDLESSRLLDDDIYQSGYGYGALNHANQLNHPDPESIKREREALEAICQRTSDSVIDIWSLQPQPHLQPQATLHNSISPKTRTGHDDVPVTITTTAPADNAHAAQAKGGAVPKHWGEVIINPKKKNRSRPGSNEGDNRDVFGVLNVA